MTFIMKDYWIWSKAFSISNEMIIWFCQFFFSLMWWIAFTNNPLSFLFCGIICSININSYFKVCWKSLLNPSNLIPVWLFFCLETFFFFFILYCNIYRLKPPLCPVLHHTSALSHIYCSAISLQKNIGLPVWPTEHVIIRCK